MNPKGKNRANCKTPEEGDDLNALKHLLREAIPPISPQKLEPRSDLWPRLHARIESQLAASSVSTNRALSATRIPWFDWALAVLTAAALLFFPGIIPALLYHF